MPLAGQGRPEHTPFRGRPKRVCIVSFTIRSRSSNSYICNEPAGKVRPSKGGNRYTVQPFLTVRVHVLNGTLEEAFRAIDRSFRPPKCPPLSA